MANNKNESSELYKLLDSRYRLAKKFSKDYIKEAKRALKDYELDSFDEYGSSAKKDDLWNKLQVPYIFSTIESGIPAMFDNMPNIVVQAGGKKDALVTEFADSIWSYLKRELGLKNLTKDVGFTFMLTGVGSARYGWVTETDNVKETKSEPILDELGQPLMSADGQPVTQEFTNEYEVITKNMPTVDYNRYNKIFFSPESTFTIDDDSGKIPYILFEESLTTDQIEYLYDVKLEAVDIIDLKDVDEDLDTNDESLEKAGIQKSDIQRIKVISYCGQLPKKYLSKELQENWKPTNVYKTVFTSAEHKILAAPEITNKKPHLLLGNYGSPDKFWHFGEAKALRELEADVSLGRSIVADYRDRLATKVAMPHTAEFDEESFRSPKEFTIVKFLGQQYPQYITPPPVPETVMSGINMSREDIQMTSGQLDISRGGTSSTVNTATGQKIFESVHEKRIAQKRDKVGTFMSALATNLLLLCAENWSVEEFAKVTDMDPQMIEQEQLIDKLADITKGYDLIIDVESMTDNKETESAQAIALYREMKDQMSVNQDELLKYVVQVGFRQKDPDRFLSQEVTPEQMVRSLEEMVKMGAIPQDVAAQILQQIMASTQPQNGGGDMGRPATQDPTQVVEKGMPGADNTQITAQTEAAYKQQGVPK